MIVVMMMMSTCVLSDVRLIGCKRGFVTAMQSLMRFRNLHSLAPRFQELDQKRAVERSRKLRMENKVEP